MERSNITIIQYLYINCYTPNTRLNIYYIPDNVRTNPVDDYSIRSITVLQEPYSFTEAQDISLESYNTDVEQQISLDYLREFLVNGTQTEYVFQYNNEEKTIPISISSFNKENEEDKCNVCYKTGDINKVNTGCDCIEKSCFDCFAPKCIVDDKTITFKCYMCRLSNHINYTKIN
jgi:hypothetical protein